jgi:hypothetical protein
MIQVIQMPAGNWGLGPSLLYLFGMVGVLCVMAWNSHKDQPKRRQSDEELLEEQKRAVFTRLMIDAAKERSN